MAYRKTLPSPYRQSGKGYRKFRGVTVIGATIPKRHALGPRKQALEDWLHQQAAPAYDAYHADPSRGLPLEQVRAPPRQPQPLITSR